MDRKVVIDIMNPDTAQWLFDNCCPVSHVEDNIIGRREIHKVGFQCEPTPGLVFNVLPWTPK